VTHLEETETVQELPNIVDNPGPLDEDVPLLLVHDQIEVPLPVSLLLILESVVFGRKLVQVGREEDDRRRRDREFATLGTHGSSGNSDDVTSTEESVESFEVGGGFGFSTKDETREVSFQFARFNEDRSNRLRRKRSGD
jgi:hypothetical protein